MSDEQFNSLFGASAQLDGFTPNGNYKINQYQVMAEKMALV